MFSRMLESFTKKASELVSDLADAVVSVPFKLEVAVRSAIRPYQLEREIELARQRLATEGKTHHGHDSYNFGYLRSNDWTKIRRHATRYLGGKCEFCGNKAHAVHHVRYPPKDDRGLESISWLVVVCDECHKKLHGGSEGTLSGQCVLCGRAKAIAELDVAYKKFANETQPVCIPCKALASGLRDVARGWTYSGYLAWLEHWSLTADKPDWSSSDASVAAALVTKRESPSMDLVQASERTKPIVRPCEPIDMTPDPALLRLAELRRNYRAMPERELRAIWDSRESSDLEPEELKAVRAAIRENMGLPTDAETSEELDQAILLGNCGSSRQVSFRPYEGTRLSNAINKLASEKPADFYALFDNAEEFQLSFPIDEEGTGPHWDEWGKFAGSAANETEEVRAIPLGAGLFRLAERMHGPFSCLRINWGDEFFAIREGKNLRITRMATPMKFRHYRFLMQPGFGNDNILAETVQSLGGGWECIAGGLVTLTVPLERDAEFSSAMDGIGLPSVTFAITD